MANHPPRTSAPFPFFPTDSQGTFLFSVNADVPIEDALETASSYLLSALEVARSNAEEAKTSHGWAAVYLIEMAQAIVCTSSESLMKGSCHA